MAKIDIRSFGGLVPKLTPRGLPSEAAQVAHNLEQNTSEFRPLADDVQVLANSGVNNPKTIFRFKRKADGTLNTDFTVAGNWRVSAARQSWAAGQVNNDLTDRHYVSFDDGSAPPRAIDATGSDRQLGVPQPASVPTLVLNTVEEFTTEERADSITAIDSYLTGMCKAGFPQPVFRGSSSLDSADYRPGGTHPGYLDRDMDPGIDPEETQQLRAFRTTSVAGAFNGSISDDYTGGSAETWPFDAAIGGLWRTANGLWPAWAGTTYDHWCVPFHAYGLTYDLKVEYATDTLAGMQMPGLDTVQPLLTSDQVTEAVTRLQALYDARWEAAKPLLNALYARVQEAKILMDRGTAGALASAVAAFYAQPEITGIFAAAVAATAESIWNTAVQAHAWADYVDSTGGGGGG